MPRDEYESAESIRALDHNAGVKARNGWSVVDKRDGSCKVVIASGTLGTGNGALEVTAGTAITSGTATNVATQAVDIDEGDPDDPRKDVVSVDAAGAAQVHKGAAKPQDPTNVSLENAEQPAPKSLNGVDAVPLSMVTVPAGATSITSGNLADKRERADREFGHIRSQSSTTEVISNDIQFAFAGDDDLQTIFDNAKVGSTVYLVEGSAQKFTPSTPPTISKSLSIETPGLGTVGQEPHPGDGIDLSQVTGAYIEQQGPGEDGLEITVDSREVDIRNLLITWESSLRDSNTGHGINGNPPTDADATGQEGGVFNSEWRNIAVGGVDGDHYGYYVTNPQLCEFGNLQSYGGGGLHLENNSDETNFGNTTVSQFYAHVRNGAAAAGNGDGIYLNSTVGTMNLNVFVRPQVNVTVDSNNQHVNVNSTSQVKNNGWLYLNLESSPKGAGGVTTADTDNYIPMFNDTGTALPGIDLDDGVDFDLQKNFLQHDILDAKTVVRSRGRMQTDAQDLSTVSASDGHVYNHNGASSISADGGTTSSPGWYVWSATDAEWKAMAQY